MSTISIRIATDLDFDEIWDIFHRVIASGDTYAHSPHTTKEDAYFFWMPPHKKTYVAMLHGKIVGTYFIKANQPDSGSHIANAAYIVHPEQQGKGIGFAIVTHSIEEAKKLGFTAMQFNLVVSTNAPAIKLYEKLGFKIIGTTPQGFKHPTQGFVDAYILHKFL